MRLQPDELSFIFNSQCPFLIFIFAVHSLTATDVVFICTAFAPRHVSMAAYLGADRRSSLVAWLLTERPDRVVAVGADGGVNKITVRAYRGPSPTT